MTKEQIKTLNDEIARADEQRRWGSDDVAHRATWYANGLRKAKEIMGVTE